MPIIKNREERLQTISHRLNRWGRKPVTTTDLANQCGVSPSTIKKDIDYLKDVLNAPICYCRKPNGYYFTEPFELAATVTLTDRDMAALETAVATLNQFRHLTIFQDLRGTVDKLEKAVRFRTGQLAYPTFIQFESVPYAKGSELIEVFLTAIAGQRVVHFAHQKFETEAIKSHRLLPFLIKEHRNRWYVVGWQADYGEIRVFGLDRILPESVQSADESVVAPDFDADAYFRRALGVAVYDVPAQEVILSFSREDGLHFRSHPFYPFLEEDVLLEDENEFRVRLWIIVNRELIYELARLGPKVRVLAPAELVSELRGFLLQAANQYVSA